VRAVNGDGREEIRLWSPCRNEHRDGILDRTVSPATGLPEASLARARAGMVAALSGLDHEGVLCIEFFVSRGSLIANEMAPRVHNSGHWTIEGAETSQFENHLRAVARLPLGSTAAHGPVAMVNLIGTPPPVEAVLAIPGARLHLYGKEPRLGRKVGHVTVLAESADALRERLGMLAQVVPVPDAARAF
jgi:5-(carboxyamino)imidazole ribonucleotide synthase